MPLTNTEINKILTMVIEFIIYVYRKKNLLNKPPYRKATRAAYCIN